MIIDFDIISNESKLWIYGSDKNLSFKQQNYILKNISKYLKEWKYHNNPLTSAVTILENRFLIVALDDTEYGVGGCSIDSFEGFEEDIRDNIITDWVSNLNASKLFINTYNRLPNLILMFCRNVHVLN